MIDGTTSKGESGEATPSGGQGKVTYIGITYLPGRTFSLGIIVDAAEGLPLADLSAQEAAAITELWKASHGDADWNGSHLHFNLPRDKQRG
jgi:hypothetical protein